MKKILSVMLSVIITLGVLAPARVLAADDYLFYLTYSDIQAHDGSEDLKWSGSIGVSNQTIDKVYLAKNEREGFQVFFYERGEGRNLKVSVAPFVNSAGEVLAHTLYNEIYLMPTGVTTSYFADALVPYNGEIVETKQNDNNMFYIDLKSTKDQTPGNYVSTVTLYDGEEILAEKNITAVVWNFALPEGHYGTTFAGLYDSESRYTITAGFLKLNGVRFNNYEVIDEDKELAEQILEGWDETLLEHGVSAYEIPRFMIDNDSKQAELTLADPRRSAFCVPLLTKTLDSNGKLNKTTENKIVQYKDLVYDNKFIKDKALFYYADEITWATEEDASSYIAFSNVLSNLWPGYHSVTPINSSANFAVKKSILQQHSDILCMNQGMIARNPEMVNEFIDKSWNKTWRYGGDTLFGGTPLYRWDAYNMGVFARIMYWQADALGSNGILHWNYGYVPFDGNSAYNVFENNALAAKNWVSTGDGDGILLYAGGPLGLDPTQPIVSLRLKHVNNGMDDFDYLQLAKEFFGEDSNEYNTAINSVLRYKTRGLEHIFEPWDCALTSGIRQEWIHNDSRPMNNARIALGNALSAANTEHNYGEWEIAVGCDDNHNGLEIRTCNACGAQESRELNACESDGHNYETTTVPATCTADGSSTEKCTRCGDTKTTVLHATGHQNTTTIREVSATCTTDGITSGVYCNDCKTYISGHEIIKATSHKSDAGVVTTESSCSATGTKTYTCTVCNEVLKTETIAKKNHTNSDWIVDSDSTCTKTGSKHTECTVCKTVLETQTIAKKAHSYTTTNYEATCTQKGYTLHKCSVCGDSYKSDETDLKAHTPVVYKEAKPATCTENGYSAETRCMVCSAVVKASVIIKATGHTDADKNGVCDTCGVQIASNCSHMCHKTGFSGFIWKIINFFNRLFKINKVCECGARHY